MDQRNRIYGEQVDIDAEQIKQFYDQRAQKAALNPDAPVVLKSDTDAGAIALWTQYEVTHCLPRLRLDGDSRVLEPGCGTGRLSKYLAAQAGFYLGVEGAEQLYDIARGRTDINRETSLFLNLSLERPESWTQIGAHRPFNRFVIGGGVLMYLNDQAASLCIAQSLSMFSREGIYYISEPVSLIGRRLTLNRFYSQALNAHYSAIYRTPEEYLALFAPLCNAGFVLTYAQEMFEQDFKGQTETKQYLFLLERG